MTLTNEQLKQLTPEQLDEYSQGIDDYLSEKPLDPNWSETRKEGYRDAMEEVRDIFFQLFAKRLVRRGMLKR